MMETNPVPATTEKVREINCLYFFAVLHGDPENFYLLGFYALFCEMYVSTCGPDSSVGIATGYGLDDPVIESWWRRDFPHLSRPALGPTQPPIQ
jgi:hypothetical protein